MKVKPVRQKRPEPARFLSWRILMDWESGKASMEELREKAFANEELSARDRALVTEMTQGVLRHRTLIDHRIDTLLDRPDTSLPLPVRVLLRLGVYQIMFLNRIPSHAAVGETVNLARGSRYSGLVPLINAILRKASTSSAPSLPDIKQDPVSYLSLATSMPQWLVELLVKQRGISDTEQILRSLNRTAPLTLRVNTLKTDRDGLLAELEELEIGIRPGKISPQAVILERGSVPSLLKPFRQGRCTVQDEGAQLISPLLGAKPGETVVDACAAPGGKTGHLAQEMEGRGTIIAIDRQWERLRMTKESLIRLGISSVNLLAADVLTLPRLLTFTPDRVLLDTPCSGTGVLRRHPEGKWKKDPDRIEELARLQFDLLQAVSQTISRGGKILYTTCSLLREENEEVVDRFLGSTDFRLADLKAQFGALPESLFTERGEFRVWPHLHDCDGFYAALLVKNN
ncbi:16S rRNA (cytosine(967)-C(5))-methyltransferase RsmB [bacterium]|nr:MAG: 16S rRNA (cytosine(967)-C(5))-methyltransferase RsmB [bacterium]